MFSFVLTNAGKRECSFLAIYKQLYYMLFASQFCTHKIIFSATMCHHAVNILSLADTYSHSRTRKVLHVQHCEPILKGLDKTSTRFLYFYCLHFNTFLFALEKRRIHEIVSTVSFLHRPFIFWHQSCVVNCFDGSFYLAVAEKLCL